MPTFRRRTHGADNNAAKGEGDSVRSGLGSLVYIVVGVLVASAHHYLTHVGTIKPLASAALAIVLWPLLLLGINLHIK
jgi:hypothetical protein